MWKGRKDRKKSYYSLSLLCKLWMEGKDEVSELQRDERKEREGNRNKQRLKQRRYSACEKERDRVKSGYNVLWDCEEGKVNTVIYTEEQVTMTSTTWLLLTFIKPHKLALISCRFIRMVNEGLLTVCLLDVRQRGTLQEQEFTILPKVHYCFFCGWYITKDFHKSTYTTMLQKISYTIHISSRFHHQICMTTASKGTNNTQSPLLHICPPPFPTHHADPQDVIRVKIGILVVKLL